VSRSDAGCGYHQLVYSSLVGLKQQDHSLFDDSLLAARSVSLPVVLYVQDGPKNGLFFKVCNSHMC